MQASRLKEITHASLREWGLFNNIPTSSDESRILIERIANAFSVSTEAARVRLSQLGYLSTASHTIPLF